jgi:hypothetical protein
MSGEGRSAVTPLRTVRTFIRGRACSDTLLHVLHCAYDRPMPEEECAAMPLAGGIMQRGHQCGMIWGATVAAGAEAHRRLGDGPRAEAQAVAAAARLLEAFRAQNSATDCFDLTEIDDSSTKMEMMTYFLLKGGAVRCFAGAARYASVAKEAIDAVLFASPDEAPPAPVSCAALLARRMGASGLHAVMAAGFAGGIGLGGGGCGALATAIWITGMKALRDGAARLNFESPHALAVIERFLAGTGGQFECAAICGRRFVGVEEHAAYLRGAACAALVEALAAGTTRSTGRVPRSR